MRLAVAVPLGALALALVACGGDKKDGSSTATASSKATVLFVDWEPTVIGNPEKPVTRADAKQLAGAAGVVVAAETPGRFWALRRTGALSGREIGSAKQSLDPVTNQPVVGLTLTGDGRARFQALTRAVAGRAKSKGTQQHFAIIVDGKVVTRPFVDPRTSPNGIDATNGIQISGGLTVAEAKRLADRIDGGG